MIYTITLNPALDISGTVDELIPNEKSYVYDEIITPGGNGINAAIIAKRLAAKVLATGFLGGSNGREIEGLLSQEKLSHHFLPIAGRTRINLTVSNKKTHKQTRLSFPGPMIKKDELGEMKKFLKLVDSKDLVLIGGSLPPGVKPSFVTGLIREARKRGARCMVDIPGKPLREVLGGRPDFIKPNLVEFQDLVGKKVEALPEVLKEVRKLNLPLVCVSSVEGGAILVSPEEAWYGKIPKVKVVSSVGAGDSMVGAIASCLEKRGSCPVEELLREGLAAACATLTEEGMTLGSKQSIQKYRPLILLKKII